MAHDEVTVDTRINALLTLTQGCFDRRKQLEAIEWKVNFALWTATAVSAWALHGLPHAEHLGSGARLFWLIPVMHLIALTRFIAHENRMRDLGTSYLEQAEKLIGTKKPYSSVPPPSQLWWFFIELSPTVVLASVAVILAW